VCPEIEPARQIYGKYYYVKLLDNLPSGDSQGVTCRLAKEDDAKRRFFVQSCVPNTSPSTPPPQKNLGTLAVVTQIEYLVSYGWTPALLIGVALSTRVLD
jgi:hypothetical protein